jgi:putative peptidoglycan lipid II flippase
LRLVPVATIDWLPASVRGLLDRYVPPGALLLAVLTFGYFMMGQLRNRVFANTYGTSPELDAYYAAFRIPEIALDVLVASGLTAPFVPIFSSLRERDERGANDFGRTVLSVAVLAMFVAVVVLFVLAPWIGDTYGGGFTASARADYVNLLRINCVAQVLFAASIAIGEVLVANRRFFYYALAPILYTGGIVLGTVLFAHQIGIYATAWGATAGAVAHLAIRTLGTRWTSFRPGASFRVRTPAFHEFVLLMLPRMVSYPIDPLLFAVFTSIAISLGSGSVSALNFASDYQVVPVQLIGVAFSLAAFPTLAAAWAERDRSLFVTTLRRNVAVIGGLTAIAAVVLGILAPLLVRVLLGGGRFGSEAVAVTSSVLAVYAVSVPFDALSYPLSRALYATHNTALQVIASVIGFAVAVGLAYLLAPTIGIVAIPLAYAVGAAVKVVLLALFLVPRLRRLPQPTSARA